MPTIKENPKYMDTPYIENDIMYNICDCGNYQVLTKSIIENGYRCLKCGQKWIARSVK